MQYTSRTSAIFLLLFGIIALVLGAAVYLLIRDPDSLYIVRKVSPVRGNLFFSEDLQKPLSILIGSLPTAIHTFAFSLFTSVAMGLRKPNVVISCVFWAIINIAFEFSQSLKTCPAFLIDNEDQASFGIFCSYAVWGTFDWLDVGSIIIGVLFAYLLLIRLTPYPGDKDEKH
ncbi:hypothetical protein [uncultured Thiodictyon sp.]|uniref:hypothetical protein n=1 Tax=uncultured Thiodictyon sp. TaxID=1846217 RepID=UPI0025D57BF1|nr:hypothetical protein [uncultured Thiodictyon sp.]